MNYERTVHAARSTSDYVFHQLVPYIGSKRKLLGLIAEALVRTDVQPEASTFADLFAGSGVVARFAKRQGFAVVANDWEPYAEAINTAYVGCNAAPTFARTGGYARTIELLNSVPPIEGWVSRHLCPRDDEHPDPDRERMFFLRKNGMRIDAIRSRIEEWSAGGEIDRVERAALLAPLLYAACYASNTSGVFKGFHRGWGGATATALYRIKAPVGLAPAIFFDNRRHNTVTCHDARVAAGQLASDGVRVDVAYLDPPYNQHPYASNYHVLNTLTLWDAPPLSRTIEGRGSKAAIRTDWRDTRRSAFNSRADAAREYQSLLAAIEARWVITSYSTEGNIPLDKLVCANREMGDVRVCIRPYKRYRVSTQRYSAKPVNAEFVLVTKVGARPTQSVEEIVDLVRASESVAVASHWEARAAAARQQELL